MNMVFGINNHPSQMGGQPSTSAYTLIFLVEAICKYISSSIYVLYVAIIKPNFFFNFLIEVTRFIKNTF